MQAELGIILGDFTSLLGAFTAIACGLLVLFWTTFPGRYKAKPNQPSYPALVALVSAIIMTIVMLLPFVITIVIISVVLPILLNTSSIHSLERCS